MPPRGATRYMWSILGPYDFKISEWSIQNFKSLEYASLPLNKITILTGPNSSGKSSVIQSLLIVAQSSNDEIVLNGPLARLGNPVDVIRRDQDAITISFSATKNDFENDPEDWAFEISLKPVGSKLKVVEFNAAKNGIQSISASDTRIPKSLKSEIDPESKLGDATLRVSILDGKTAPPRTFLTFSGLFPSTLVARRSEKQIFNHIKRKIGRKYLQENPRSLFYLYEDLERWWISERNNYTLQVQDRVNREFKAHNKRSRSQIKNRQTHIEEIIRLYSQTATDDPWLNIPVDPYRIAMHDYADSKNVELEINNSLYEGLRALINCQRLLEEIKQNVIYLGPLREEPQVVSTSGIRHTALPAGKKGEYTADLLTSEKNKQVSFNSPNKSRVRDSLPEAVSLWTNYLGVGENIGVEDQGKLGRGVRLYVNGIQRDLTSVGVGASQLLPVITTVLAAKPNSIVCLEQPELHLHPAVQSRLSDFFLIARPDISLIIETHSEYLITRLRRRIADQTIDPTEVSIFFAEQTAGVTNLSELEISQLGNFSEWPKGFFDTQEIEERQIVELIQKRILKKQVDS